MKFKSPLTDEQIGKKIKAGKDFWVETNKERKLAKGAAGFLGIDVTTRKSKFNTGFNVYFLPVVNNANGK